MPYGKKSAQWLKSRVQSIIRMLFEKYNVDLIIIACNTASTVTDRATNVITMKFINKYTYLATQLTKINLPDFDIIADNSLAKQIENNILNEMKIKQIASKNLLPVLKHFRPRLF